MKSYNCTRLERARAALFGASALFSTCLLGGTAHAQDQSQVAGDQIPDQQPSDEQPADQNEIVVTGTSIRGVPPTGSNLIEVSREDIERIGATTTPELLATVPQLNSFNTAPRTSNGGVGSFAPGLRGLPSSATLPLMNGHRLISGSVQQTNGDFPFLPEMAVERVEIVADGASAIYGSDAVAGVVNFITRKRFSGVEASIKYGAADDYHAFSAGAIAGKTWSTGSIVASYQYSKNNNIRGDDRAYRTLDFRDAGGVDTRSAVCPDANVNLFTGTIYGAPSLAPGANLCDPRGPVDLLPAERMHTGYVTARQEVASNAKLWGEILYTDRKDTVQAALPGQTFVLLLPSNPFFRAPPSTGAFFEFVDFRPDNLVGADHFDQTYRVRTGNASAGVDVKLAHDFNLSVYGTFDFSQNDTFQPGLNTAALTAAAAGTTTATALDPFGTGTSPAVVASILDYNTNFTNHQRTKIAAVKIDGPLAELPGGDLKIAAGAEFRRETYKQRGDSGGVGFPEDFDRNVTSLYGELFVPFFGPGNEAPFAHSLSLSLSGRYDHYSDFGSTTNPKVGVDWEPVDWLTFRGTYGRSFRAPGLRDLGSTVGSYFAAAALVDAFGVRDPTRTTQVNTMILLGGNDELKPEKARTYSFGLDLRPKAVPGLNASATFYDIKYEDVIGTPYGLGALIFTDPTFASRVTRNPSAAQLSSAIEDTVPFFYTLDAVPLIGNLLDTRQGNFGIRKTNGLDFDVNYSRQTHFGSVFGGIAGNTIFKYKTQFSPTSDVSNSLKAGVPRTTLRTTLGFTAGPVTFVNYVNHRSGITSTFATPTGSDTYKADGYTTVDLRLSFRLPDTGFAKGTELGLQVNDLFDATPPFFPSGDGIGGTYNPIGRYFAASLRTKF